MTPVERILQKKGPHVHSITEDATVLDAAGIMNTQRVGALVVTRGDKVVGIFTERDVLNRVVAARRDPGKVSVGEVMSAPVACCTPQTSPDECRAVMRSQRLRHLPVVDAGRLVGIVSIGDLLQDAEESQQQTIQFLHEYIHGGWAE